MTGRPLPLSPRSGAAIAATSAVGLLAFFWPMLVPRGSELLAHASDAPVLFGLLVPLLLAVTLTLVGDGAMGAKAVALLGILAATAAALRAVGAGVAGLEPIWIVIVVLPVLILIAIPIVLIVVGIRWLVRRARNRRRAG